MRYPRLPYQTKKVKKLLTKFLGVNFTDNYQEGEFADTLGLSTENYPTITQRLGRENIDFYGDEVTDLFEWNGKFVVVAGSILYYDRQALTNVIPGKKQFAVVNTHLIVMPDKIDIDLTSGGSGSTYTFTQLDAKLITSASTNSSTFSNGNQIQGALSGYRTHFMDSTIYYWFHDGENANGYTKPLFYTYGTNRAAVEACWQNGAWNMTALAALEHLTWWDAMGGSATQLTDGQIMIPVKGGGSNYYIPTGNGTNVNGSRSVTTYPSKANYNTQGMYCVYHTTEEDYENGSEQAVYFVETGRVAMWIKSPGFDMYCATQQNWSDRFKVGDLIKCTGTTNHAYDFSEAKVTAIDDATNTITVAGKDSSGEYTTTPFPTTQQKYSIAITFQNIFPDLDYVCERANRLWGVSNKDKTLYVSALGIPSQFYDYGTDTGSWSTAFGSEGDFTAIYNYGGATCCFKEKRLHKVFGDYPSNFYMSEYEIDGVQKGSEKSLAVVNETLFYKGINGVFTFGGGSPTLISASLGREPYYEAVGGSDGERYYISVKDMDNNAALLTYDLVNGLWIKEDNIKVDAFTRAEYFYMATGGTIYKMGLYNNEKFEWMAELKPFYTMTTSSSSYTRSIGKQFVTKLVLGLEMEKGSRVTVETKEDNGLWKAAATHTADKDLSLVIPIRIGRCSKIGVRLSGCGRVKIRSLEREYNVGSEV